jgi:hypothetical protein
MAERHYVVLFDGLIFRKNHAANHRMSWHERSVIEALFQRAIDSSTVIASQRVGAKRRPMTGSAK